MRVLFVIRDFLHYSSELSNALAKSGLEVIILAADSGWDFVGTGEKDAKEDYKYLLDPRIKLEWMHIPKDTSLSTLMANLRSIAHIIKRIRHYNPDIIHTMDAADYRMLASLYACRLRYPIILTIHDANTHPGDAKNRMEFMRPWLRRIADGIVVHGKDIEDRLLAACSGLKNRLNRVPRGPYTIYQKWASPDQKSDGKTILFFGRISKYKGLEYLIKCAPQVATHLPDVKFVIAGSGPDWSRCKEMIINPENFVLREEKIPEPEVTRLVQQASVVVLPYIEASQSGVLFIAFAFGKPVVVTNVGALPEAVDDGETGIIVPPGDEDSLAKAIINLLENPVLAQSLGQRALEKVTTGELSWPSIAAKTTEVYEAARKRRRK